MENTTPIQNQKLSLPRIMLSLEGLIVLMSSIVAYWYIGGNGWLFIALLLVPDLTFIVYMMNQFIGTVAYNIVHTYTLPLILLTLALVVGWQMGIMLSLIWFAHIGMDRTIGYGLKYQTAFKDTHMNRV